MRLLIDTNIFIYREDYGVVPENLQRLIKILNDLGAHILVHPMSVEEIKRDEDAERREVSLSKIKTYTFVENPPEATDDKKFIALVGQTDDPHEIVDNNLLFCIQKEAAQYLITEDKGIHRKAEKIQLSDRVLSVSEAIDSFEGFLPKEAVRTPPSLNHVPLYTLDIEDPIFNSLKQEYPDFEKWWRKKCREGRKAWVYFQENRTIGAILILKLEEESIPSTPSLPEKKRVKICTLKVKETGHKIGELFIKISVRLAIKNQRDELYLTHFTKLEGDRLVDLIKEFGFNQAAKTSDGEAVYVKNIYPIRNGYVPIEIDKQFYPGFYDGEKVKKFLVPIQPQYHDRLFIDWPGRQHSLFEFSKTGAELITEGNTIKKAYICHSKTRKVSTGDILLFYRSRDKKSVTTLGIAEEVYDDITSAERIIHLIGKRSVYSIPEIEELTIKPTKVILFRQHFNFPIPVSRDFLNEEDIMCWAPQSITEIENEEYQLIKNKGGIDESFTVD